MGIIRIQGIWKDKNSRAYIQRDMDKNLDSTFRKWYEFGTHTHTHTSNKKKKKKKKSRIHALSLIQIIGNVISVLDMNNR